MARKLGLASRFVPRFGLLWTVAAMLLFISAAGWWKFHRDLYVEERKAIEGLKSLGARIGTHRGHSPYSLMWPEEENTIPWNAPFLEPVRQLVVQGETSTEARNAALRLPRLTLYRVSSAPTAPVVSVPLGVAPAHNWPGIEDHLGRPLPAYPDRALQYDLLDRPLPEGAPVAEGEAKRIAAAICAAWRNHDATAPRQLVASETTQDGAAPYYNREIIVEVIEPERSFRYSALMHNPAPSNGIVLDPESEQRPTYESAGFFAGARWAGFERGLDQPWKRKSWNTPLDQDGNESKYVPKLTEEFPYCLADFNGEQIAARAMGAFTVDSFARIARVDDLRYRVDLAPFEVPLDEIAKASNRAPPQVQEWVCVVRSDLDWVPESYSIDHSRTYWSGAKVRHERRVVQRLSRENGYVTLQERVARERSGTPATPTTPGPPTLTHARFARELDPAYEERVFDPLSLDPDPWPKRRELPWLCWYRVTFVLGCSLGLFLVGRKLMPRAESSDSADLKDVDGETPPSD